MRPFLGWLLVCSFLFPSASFANGTPGLNEVVYAVTLNNINVSDGTILLRDSSHQLYAKVSDLNAWRLNPSTASCLTYEGDRYAALTSIESLAQKVDEDTDRLALTITADKLSGVAFNMHSAAGMNSIAQSETSGSFLNYDLHAEGGSAPRLNGLFEINTRLGTGVFDTSALANAIGGGSRLIPIQTSWRHDSVDNHNSVIVGDATTLPTSFNNEITMTGIRFARNFGTEPDLVTAPRASVSGTAAVPSVLNMYVNNALTYAQNVPAGPYQINSLPVIDGLGNVQLVMRDVQGREQVINTSYYTGINLLGKGISSFEYDAGFLRSTAANGNQRYGDFVGRAYNRYGFSNQFTGEASAEYSSHDAALGVAGNAQIGRIGVINAGISASSSASHVGTLLTTGYNYTNSNLNLGFSYSSAGAAFVQAGELANQGIQRNIQASLGLQVGRGSLGFAYGSQLNALLGNVRATTVSYTRLLGRNTLDIAVSRTSGTSAGTNATMLLRLPVGRRTQVTPSLVTASGVSSPGMSIDRRDNDTAYQAAIVTGHNGYATGTMLLRQPAGDIAAAFSAQSGSLQYSADLSGAVSRVDGRVFRSEPIQDGYGIAEIPNYPGIHVFEGGRMIGTTNRDGYILLPSLIPYESNDISLQGTDFPLAANVETVRQSVDPTYRRPVITRFRVKNEGGVLVHLLDGTGRVLPSGTIVSDGFGHHWPVGNDGLGYIDGVTSGSLSLTAKSDDAMCEFRIDIPPVLKDMPDLGNVVCR